MALTQIPSFSGISLNLGMVLTLNDDGKLGIHMIYQLLTSSKNSLIQRTQNVFDRRTMGPSPDIWDFAGHEKSGKKKLLLYILKALLKCPARCNFCTGHFAQFPLAGENVAKCPGHEIFAKHVRQVLRALSLIT